MLGESPMRLAPMLSKLLKVGSLTIVAANGQSECVSVTATPSVKVRIAERSLYWKLLVAPNYFIPQAYVKGSLTIEEGELRDLLTILMAGLPDGTPPTSFERFRRWLEPYIDWLFGVGHLTRIKQDVQFHYDLSNEFFQLFLD